MVPLAAMVAAMGFSPSGVSATAQVYDQDSKVLAEARFDGSADTFTLVGRVAGDQPYLEYHYVRVDGSLQTGTHRGVPEAGTPVRFAHHFGAGRTVTFRVCVSGEHGFNPCSGTDAGENWTVAIA
ncbi:hypothetical protein [Actinoplanes ianthinogenes]|nr:hypothetical protein [Actinoplanes ianthinogenes]